jgi:hypothetical protein
MNFFKELVGQIRAKWQTDAEGQLEEADAIILEFHPTGAIRKGLSEARLLLQVMPKNGRNYVTECSNYFTLGHLQEFHSGAKTKIYFRQNEPFKIRWVKT